MLTCGPALAGDGGEHLSFFLSFFFFCCLNLLFFLFPPFHSSSSNLSSRLTREKTPNDSACPAQFYHSILKKASGELIVQGGSGREPLPEAEDWRRLKGRCFSAGSKQETSLGPRELLRGCPRVLRHGRGSPPCWVYGGPARTPILPTQPRRHLAPGAMLHF